MPLQLRGACGKGLVGEPRVVCISNVGIILCGLAAGRRIAFVVYSWSKSSEVHSVRLEHINARSIQFKPVDFRRIPAAAEAPLSQQFLILTFATCTRVWSYSAGAGAAIWRSRGVRGATPAGDKKSNG